MHNVYTHYFSVYFNHINFVFSKSVFSCMQMCLLNSVWNVHIKRCWTGLRCRIIAIFNVSSIRNDNEISNIRYEVINTQCKLNVQSDWINNSRPRPSSSRCTVDVVSISSALDAPDMVWSWLPVQGCMLPSENTGHGRWKQPINMQPPRVTAGVVE